MGVWHPSPDETFVYLHVGSGKRFVLMVPGGGAPKSITLHTELGDALYNLDEAMTDKTRMFVSVDNRKRAEGLAD